MFPWYLVYVSFPLGLQLRTELTTESTKLSHVVFMYLFVIPGSVRYVEWLDLYRPTLDNDLEADIEMMEADQDLAAMEAQQRAAAEDEALPDQPAGANEPQQPQQEQQGQEQQGNNSNNNNGNANQTDNNAANNNNNNNNNVQNGANSMPSLKLDSSGLTRVESLSSPTNNVQLQISIEPPTPLPVLQTQTSGMILRFVCTKV
jgi:hypothetical protein